MKLSDIKGLRPKGHMAYIPFYLKSSGESIILFAEKANPTDSDNAYELGKITIISRTIDQY